MKEQRKILELDSDSFSNFALAIKNAVNHLEKIKNSLNKDKINADSLIDVFTKDRGLSINVLGHKYMIDAHAKGEAPDGTLIWGKCYFFEQRIFINTNRNISDKKLRETVIHEITHAYHFEWNGLAVLKEEDELLAIFVSKFIDEILGQANVVTDRILTVSKSWLEEDKKEETSVSPFVKALKSKRTAEDEYYGNFNHICGESE